MRPYLKAATFGAGCFWHVEEIFHHIKGIKETEVGYMCGRTKNFFVIIPDVCSKSMFLIFLKR